MGITINGSSAAGNIDLGTNGTITDLAVGGLPDGTVDADTLASGAGGAALTGSTDNTICTVTGANAIQGETNLRFDGSTLHVNDAATDIGDPQLQVYSEAGPKPGEIGLYSQKGTMASNDKVGSVSFWGRDGNITTAVKTAEILVQGDGTWASNDHPSRMEFYLTADGVGAVTKRFSIGANGQPGFDFGSTYAYFNKGDTGVIVEFRTGGTAKGNIGIGGSDVSYNETSDYRLKENVAPITDGITRVKQLKPSKFNWIADSTNTLIDGFLAHEVSSVVPNAITGDKDAVDEDGNAIHQVIAPSKMIPLLTAALQEAITKIETLETKVAALEAG